MTLTFSVLDASHAGETLPLLYDILRGNMGSLTGMDRDTYISVISGAILKPARKIILIHDSGILVGFFQYYVNAARFMMEEVQLLPAYQASGAFRTLMGFVMDTIPEDTPYVEAFAHRENVRSQRILTHLGLNHVDTDGDFLHFRGDFRPFRGKYKFTPARALGRNTMKLLIMNGPNLNLLGKREPDIYGKNTYEDLKNLISDHAKVRGVEVAFFQSNHEGALVDAIQEAMGVVDGIVINPAAYTHTSVALLDAVKAVGIPTVEVHISDPDTREDFRHISYIRLACVATVKGRGFQGYLDAMDILIDRAK